MSRYRASSIGTTYIVLQKTMNGLVTVISLENHEALQCDGDLSFRHLMCLVVLSLLNFLPPRCFYITTVSKSQKHDRHSNSLPNEIAV